MFSKSIIALALAGSAIANPLMERGVCNDACAAAVTGKAALGDKSIRASHCASFLATTVTPPAITYTVTVTGTSSSAKSGWKRTDVTYCPNKVPVYATAACGGAEEGGPAYSSACSCLGFTADKTTTIAPTTTTKTVYVVPTWASTCSSATTTITVTSAAPGGPTGSGYYYGTSTSTVTVTTTASPAGATGSGYLPSTVTVTTTASPAPSPVSNTTCLTDDQASSVISAFINFLENTGANFDTALANQVLASDFTDWSDSINFMVNTQGGSLPLGGVTFGSPQAFIGGQGAQPAIPVVTTLGLHHDCTTITWRWRASFGYGNSVQGINFMIINAAGQLETNYSEFDNAAWLANYGNPQCKAAVAAASASGLAAGAANCTSSAGSPNPTKRSILLEY